MQGAQRKLKCGNWAQRYTYAQYSWSLQVRIQIQFASPSEPFPFDGLTAHGQGFVAMKLRWRLQFI